MALFEEHPFFASHPKTFPSAMVFVSQEMEHAMDEVKCQFPFHTGMKTFRLAEGGLR